MKFALIGADQDCLELLDAIVRSATGELVAVYDDRRELEPVIRSLAPQAVWSSEWEALLHEPVAEAVIVSSWRHRSSGDSQIRADQLRKLVQAAMPIIAIHPVCEAIIGFETEMIRQDTGGVIVPYVPAGSWLPVEALREPLGHSEVLEQIVVERSALNFSPDEVRVLLARDVFSLAPLIGRVRRVNAFGTALHGGPMRMTAHLECESGMEVQWAINVAPDAPRGRIRAVGPAKSLEFIAASDLKEWHRLSGPEVQRVTIPEVAQAFVNHFAGKVAGGTAIDWSTACRAQEVTEVAERSAERGRTLELYHEEHSEQETFKGVMAVGSCSLLLLALLFLIIGSIVEGIRLPYVRSTEVSNELGGDSTTDQAPAPGPQSRPLLIRLWPVYPLVIFLLLQLLRLAFPPPPRASPDSRQA